MRKLALITGLATALVVPSLADAQARCERSDSGDRVAGTVVGAVAGAVLGSAIAGRRDSTTGAIIGGTAGAVIGNQITKKDGQPCPQGYYEVPARPATYGPPPGAYDYRYGPYDRGQFWAAAPRDIGQRIAFLEDRVSRGRADGSISRREAGDVRDRLDDIRRESFRLRGPGGRLSPRDYAYLDDQLDGVSRQIRWARADNDRRR